MTKRRQRKRNNPTQNKTAIAVKQSNQVGSTDGIMRSVTATAQFSGPLPPPNMLEGYNNIIPNGAERIMVMAEKQQDHRISLEKYVISQDSKRADRGLLFGFILGVLVLAAGVFIIASGKDISGLALILASLGGLIGIFIKTQHDRKEEREARSITQTEKTITKNKSK
jgi:uncharacterized membrane protein